MAKNNFIMIRASELDKLRLQQAAANLSYRIGQPVTLTDVVKMALEEYYMREEEENA